MNKRLLDRAATLAPLDSCDMMLNVELGALPFEHAAVLLRCRCRRSSSEKLFAARFSSFKRVTTEAPITIRHDKRVVLYAHGM